MKNQSKIPRYMIKSEEFWSKNTEEKEPVEILTGLQKFATCEISQVANFHNPANTAHLTAFGPTFLVVLYKFSLM